MINPDFALFDENMFHRLRGLLDGLQAPSDLPVINMTIGEPKQAAPELVSDTIAAHADHWNGYPKPAGDADMQGDVLSYITERFGAAAASIIDPDKHLLPIPGSREPLHFLGLCVSGSKPHGCALVSNPYYHAWRAGALASRGEIVYMNLTEASGYLPDLDGLSAEMLARCQIMYICTPSNPHGATASKGWLKQAVEHARVHNYLLVVDECYIDIWRGTKPIGMLEVLAEMQGGIGDPLQQVIVLNSLSKRSNAAGLRCGYMAGDARIIAAYTKLIANGGALVPTPILRAAGALYRDDAHQKAARAHYDKSFALAEEILGISAPQGGFFLWIKVSDDLDFTKRLWQQAAIRVMPGRYMAADTDVGNPGAGYIRVALVHDHDVIAEALHRMAPFLKADQKAAKEAGQVNYAS